VIGRDRHANAGDFRLAHATIPIDLQYREKYGRPRPVRKITADRRYLIDVDADINSADALKINKG
jgi:hypothetical protein